MKGWSKEKKCIGLATLYSDFERRFLRLINVWQ